jgi:PAS domain S-box-containing protein
MAYALPKPVEPWLVAALTVVDEAIIGTATGGAIVCWSEGARKLLGYTAREAIGQRRSWLTVGEEQDDIDALLDEASASVMPASRDVTWRRKDGSILRLPTSLLAVRGPLGQPCGLLEFVRRPGVAELPPDRDSAMLVQGYRERDDLFDRSLSIALRERVALLTFELSQPITAIGAYLQGSQRLLNRGAPSELARVNLAIDRALAELSRAADIVRHLRLSASLDAPDQDRTT